MIDRNALLAALRASDLSEWAVVERAVERVVVDDGARAARHERGTTWTLVAHDDVPAGRGSATLELDAATDLPVGELASTLRAMARAAVGTGWKSRPPSAPAHVTLEDPAFASGDLEPAARRVLLAKRPAGTWASLRVDARRERTSIDTKQGLHAAWPATSFRATALVAVTDRSLEIAREARRASDLRLDEAIADAATDLVLAREAHRPASPGPCALVLGPDALLHGGGHGLWSIFAALADAVVDRQGLTRYRLGTPIAPDAEGQPEPLSITSDGALDFAMASAPVGDEGEAVRRFPLVQRGIALGFGLTPREAALRKLEPNGGVRNLVVEPGTWNDADVAGIGEPGARVVEVRRLRGLAIDRHAGEARMELGVAIEHVGGARTAVEGGTVRVDLVAALANARRSARIERRGPYHGPAAIVIDRATIA